jgi:hypothetical protein
MAIIFSTLVKHGTLQFLPGVPVAFEDRDAEPYFIAAGFAEKTKEKPVHTYSEGEVDIDPETTFGNGDRLGQKVLEG